MEVTFNEETRIYKYKIKPTEHKHGRKRASGGSLWYTYSDIQTFRQDYESDIAGQKWNKKQNIKNHFESTCRSSARYVIGKNIKKQFKRPRNDDHPFCPSLGTRF